MSYGNLLSSYRLSIDNSAAGPTAGKKNGHLGPGLPVAIFQTKKKATFLMIVIIIALIVDMIFSTFSDILEHQSMSVFGLVLFILTVLIIYGIGQYFLLGLFKQISKDVRDKASYFNKLYKVLSIT